jgi:hypothetical protein
MVVRPRIVGTRRVKNPTELYKEPVSPLLPIETGVGNSPVRKSGKPSIHPEALDFKNPQQEENA